MRQLVSLLFIIALLLLGNGLYIPAKAMLAQHLLQDAWQQTLLTQGRIYKPWPWADTWPVARLTVPSMNIEQIIMQGDTGNALAFAPGRHANSDEKITLISAHRDTHFSFLKDIKKGQAISLQIASGIEKKYVVWDMYVIDTEQQHLKINNSASSLVLVTCYPFESLDVNTSKRYVVVAEEQFKTIIL